jgi:hypothetical protein
MFVIYTFQPVGGIDLEYLVKDRRQRGARFAFILAGEHCNIFYLNRISKETGNEYEWYS